METSTFFEASKVANLKAAAILNISDISILSSQNKTMYSGRTDEDKAKKYKVKNEIIPRTILKMYENLN